MPFQKKNVPLQLENFSFFLPEIMLESIIEKYNVPVPRYTSYPPANYFTELSAGEYVDAVKESNTLGDSKLSFYFHIPFCKQLCRYCACNSYAMRKTEVVNDYIKALHKEMDLVFPLLNKDRKTSQIHYGGGTPTVLDADILKDLNNHILNTFPVAENPEIAIECHPGFLTLNDWEKLCNAGFTRFSIGIQDFNLKVLETVARKPSQENISDIFKVLRDNGKRINLDFLFGLPYQTPESFLNTIEKAVELAPDRLVLFSYAHVPWLKKAQLYLEKAGLPEKNVKEEMFEKASQFLISAGYVRIGMDHFVKPDDELFEALKEGKLHRNFQGYCTRRTTAQVYAFGVTGISQLEAGYAQNTKDIEEYLSIISKGELPIKKGLLLSKNQQTVRRIIDTLMCNYSVTLSDEDKKEVNFDTQKLSEMQEDGIITFDGNTIKLVHESSPFVRNVAALLDPLMINTTKSFSKPI